MTAFYPAGPAQQPPLRATHKTMSFTYPDTGLSIGNARSFVANSAIYGASVAAVTQSGALSYLPMFGDFANGNQIQSAIATGTTMSAAQEAARLVSMGNGDSRVLGMQWAVLGDEVLYNGLVSIGWELSGADQIITDAVGSAVGGQVAGYAAFGALTEASQVLRAAITRRIIESPSTMDDQLLYILQPVTRLIAATAGQ